MADSYAKQQSLESNFFNNLNPANTSIDTLASLKALQHFYDSSDPEHGAIKDIAQEEAKWTVAGIQALKGSRMLQEKLGTGFQASHIAGQLVKQKMAQDLYNDALKDAISKGDLARLKLDKSAREVISSSSLIDRS